jgi:hypothetical protein
MKLLVRHLRSEKVQLSTRAVANAPVFAVGKSGGKQREIWNGNVISGLAVSPPRPPLLVSPSALVHLEAHPNAPIWVAKKDGSCYFDQLSLEPNLRESMGRPQIRISELVGIDGLTLGEIQTFFKPDDAAMVEDLVTPINATWAMGFAWSSFVAQSVMVGCCQRTGLEPSSFLADESQLPAYMGEVVAVATDDVMHFSNRHPDVGVNWMASLEKVFDAFDVQSNSSKDIVGAKDCTCVGIDVCGGTHLNPNGEKLAKYFMASLDLFEKPMASPEEVASYVGTVQWFDLLNRWFQLGAFTGIQ